MPSSTSIGANIALTGHAFHDKQFFLRRPNYCAIYTALRAMVPWKTITGFEYKWFSDSYHTRRVACSTSHNTATGVVMTLAAVTGIGPRQVLYNQTTTERAIVDLVDRTAKTVRLAVRGFGQSTPQTITSGQNWVICGAHREEDSRSLAQLTTIQTETSNYPSFMSRSVEMTEAQKSMGAKSSFVETPEYQRQSAKAADELKFDIGLDWYFGTKAKDTTSNPGNVTYSSSGLYEQLSGSTNNIDLGGALLTEAVLRQQMTKMEENGEGKVYHWFARPGVINYISTHFSDRLRFENGKLDTVDLQFKKILMGSVEHRFVADFTLSQLGVNDLFGLDFARRDKEAGVVEAFTLPGMRPHMRDAKPNPDGTMERDEWVYWGGFKIAEPNRHIIISDCGYV